MPRNRSAPPTNDGGRGIKIIALSSALVAIVLVVLLWERISPLVADFSDTFILAGTGGETRIVYSELLGNSSVIWTAPGGNLKRKKQLATVPHLRGYGIKGSVSPDGRTIAFKALGETAAGSTSLASLWMLDVETGQTKAILEKIELTGAPVWSPQGDKVAVVRTDSGDGGRTATILSVDAASGQSKEIAISDKDGWLSPIGWSSDGQRFFYVSTSDNGMFFNSLSIKDNKPVVQPQKLQAMARDFQLSQDGSAFAYTSLESTEPDLRAFVRVMQVPSGGDMPPSREYTSSISPAWRTTTGDLTLASLDQHSVQSAGEFTDWSIAARREPTILSTAPEGSLFAPLAWSPDGKLLSVRHIVGPSLEQMAEERLGVIDGQGRFKQVEASSFAEFIGWLP